MFDYFKNFSSNAHQVCCEESPTICVASAKTLTFIRRRNCVSHFTNVYTCSLIVIYLAQYLRYDIQIWHDGRRWHGIMRMLISMTLTVLQGHNGPAEETYQC